MVHQEQSGHLPQPNSKFVPLWQRPIVILLLILLLAAFLRIVKFGQSPPGLNQDEAVNAWNAYCLLKTGKDQAGVSWPIYYMRGLGGNYTTFHLYVLLPFQALGGLNIITTRLPAIIGGILTVFLIYLLGKQLFDQTVGLWAAALLALNPWHIQLSRWGHEASLCPLYGILPLLLLLSANMPFREDKTHPPKIALAALAGAVTGILFYAYQAVRLFVPVFLLAAGLLTLPSWWRSIKTRKGALAVAAFALAFLLVAGPMIWQHISHPEGVAVRAIWAWNPSDSLTTKIWIVLGRYINHFSPDFLFIRGDIYGTQKLPDIGELHWYMLPLMLAGIIILLRQFKTSYSARILLAFILTYPVSDCLNEATSSHALRSAPGSCSLILLAAVGAVGAGRWLFQKNFKSASLVTAVFLVAVVFSNARFFYHFYGEYNGRRGVYERFFVDLVKACQWLRPRFDQYDAIFCTTTNMNIPYIVSLVALNYDPNRWFNENRNLVTYGGWDICTNYGKMHFMYDESFLFALKKLPPKARILFIVRPGELGFKNPIYQIYHPNGTPTLWLCQP